MPVGPSDELERTFNLLIHSFRVSGIPWWLNFGALWGYVKNNGVIPDHDLDIQTYYGKPWKRIKTVLEGRGYTMTRAMLNDVDRGNAVYMAFNHPKFLHLCITFVYPSHGIYWYCHDNHFTVDGVGIPKIGYFFKGFPERLVKPGTLPLVDVEWPGISQQIKIPVPFDSGAMLGLLYPAWFTKKQRYNVDSKHTVIEEKMVSIHKGGAISEYMVHLDSMADFDNAVKYQKAFDEGTRNYNIHLKNMKVRRHG